MDSPLIPRDDLITAAIAELVPLRAFLNKHRKYQYIGARDFERELVFAATKGHALPKPITCPLKSAQRKDQYVKGWNVAYGYTYSILAPLHALEA